MTIIFIVSSSEVDRAIRALNAVARDGVIEDERLRVWRQQENGSLLCYVPSQIGAEDHWAPITWERAIPARIFGTSTYIFHTKSVKKVPVTLLESRGITVEAIQDTHTYFVAGSKQLKKSLSLEQLLWSDQAIEHLASFRHAGWQLDGSHAPDVAVRAQAAKLLDDWIKQFEYFGARPVGEALARLLTVERAELLIPKLNLHAISDAKPNFISSLTGVGKSGPVVLHTIQKYVGSPHLGCIGEGITFHAEKGIQEPLHVFEDGLWTGFEFQKILDALIGTKPHPTVKTLSCSNWLMQVRIHLHFLIATDIGLAALNSIIQKNGLDKNIIVSHTPPVLLNILRAEAKQKFLDGHYDFTHVMADQIPESELSPAILNVSRPWLHQNLLEQISETVRTQAGYLYEVPSKLIAPLHRQWPFGASWIGSNIVFAHGAPRAALPFYWAKGSIPKKNKRIINWQPIVPEIAIDMI